MSVIRRETVVAVLLAAGLVVAAARAQEPAAQPARSDAKQPDNAQLPPVAAYVNGDPIFVAELAAGYENIAQRRELAQVRADRVKAELLDQFINRRLAVQAIERIGTLVTPEEINERMKTFELQVRQQKTTPEAFLKSRGLSWQTVKTDIIWSIGWDRYLERRLADALETYFNDHKRDLDGTRLRVSHILLRPEKYSDTQATLTARANKLREAITGGQMSFAEAAKRYSAGPSGDQGGDLGFIDRRGAMVEDFAKAAFALDVGQISEPVSTAFGTHLITVTEIKPGTKVWTQVIPEIRTLASADVLADLSKLERKTAKIEFTGLVPYLQPESGELVVPPQPPEQAAK